MTAMQVKEDVDKFQKVVAEFEDLFIDALNETEATHVAEHEIDTEDAPSVRANPRQFSPMENAEIDRQVVLL